MERMKTVGWEHCSLIMLNVIFSVILHRNESYSDACVCQYCREVEEVAWIGCHVTLQRLFDRQLVMENQTLSIGAEMAGFLLLVLMESSVVQRLLFMDFLGSPPSHAFHLKRFVVQVWCDRHHGRRSDKPPEGHAYRYNSIALHNFPCIFWSQCSRYLGFAVLLTGKIRISITLDTWLVSFGVFNCRMPKPPSRIYLNMLVGIGQLGLLG